MMNLTLIELKILGKNLSMPSTILYQKRTLYPVYLANTRNLKMAYQDLGTQNKFMKKIINI